MTALMIAALAGATAFVCLVLLFALGAIAVLQLDHNRKPASWFPVVGALIFCIGSMSLLLGVFYVAVAIINLALGRG